MYTYKIKSIKHHSSHHPLIMMAESVQNIGQQFHFHAADCARRFYCFVMNVTVYCQVQQQEPPLHHLQQVQQPVIMLCQQPAKELSSSKAHTLWGNPRNHQRDLRGILQGTLIMITLTPVETLGTMFQLVAAASDPGAKLSVMEQVGALLKRCTFFEPEYHAHVVCHHTLVSHFTAQVLNHLK